MRIGGLVAFFALSILASTATAQLPVMEQTLLKEGAETLAKAEGIEANVGSHDGAFRDTKEVGELPRATTDLEHARSKRH